MVVEAEFEEVGENGGSDAESELDLSSDDSLPGSKQTRKTRVLAVWTPLRS